MVRYSSLAYWYLCRAGDGAVCLVHIVKRPAYIATWPCWKIVVVHDVYRGNCCFATSRFLVIVSMCREVLIVIFLLPTCGGKMVYLADLFSRRSPSSRAASAQRRARACLHLDCVEWCLSWVAAVSAVAQSDSSPRTAGQTMLSRSPRIGHRVCQYQTVSNNRLPCAWEQS